MEGKKKAIGREQQVFSLFEMLCLIFMIKSLNRIQQFLFCLLCYFINLGDSFRLSLRLVTIVQMAINKIKKSHKSGMFDMNQLDQVLLLLC